MKYAIQVGFLLWVFCCNRNVADDVPLQIKSLASDDPNGFKQVFRKQVDVFGIRVYATGDTPDRKVLHAANVLAQYLDNDADSRPDNPAVISAIQKNKSAIVMFATEQKFEVIDLEAFIPVEVLDSMILQDLYGGETHLNGAAEGVFDGALEEILWICQSSGSDVQAARCVLRSLELFATLTDAFGLRAGFDTGFDTFLLNPSLRATQPKSLVLSDWQIHDILQSSS